MCWIVVNVMGFSSFVGSSGDVVDYFICENGFVGFGIVVVVYVCGVVVF